MQRIEYYQDQETTLKKFKEYLIRNGVPLKDKVFCPSSKRTSHLVTIDSSGKVVSTQDSTEKAYYEE